MTILFAGNLIAGLKNNSPVVNSSNQSASISNTDFENQSSLWAPTGMNTSTPNSFQEIELPAAYSDLWVAFNFYTLQSSGLDGLLFTCKSSVSDAIAIHSVNNILELRYWTGSAWATLSGQVSTRFNIMIDGGDTDITTTSFRFDIQIKIHSSAGYIRVYAGNLLILSFEGNTVFNSVTDLSIFRFYHTDIIQTALAEFLISTERTIGIRNYTATINGAGASTTFTSGTFASVDEETPVASTVDTDYAESTTANQVLGLALDSLANNAFEVHAVAVNARALKAAGAPEQLNAFLRVGGTNYHGADKALGTSYGPTSEVWQTNPRTAAPWAVGDIAALEAGIRSRT